MMKRILLFSLYSVFALKVEAQTPTITSFSPDSGSVGTLITIIGTNLGNPTGFVVGGTTAIVLSATATQLVGLVMPGSVAGKISVPTSGGTAVSGNDFTVKATPYPSVQQGNKLVGTGAIGALVMQGQSVSISADGNTAIVGGWYDDSDLGAAWIYTRSSGLWSQQGNKLVGTGATGTGGQGSSVAISADGNTAIVGGTGDNSRAGATWVYTRKAGVWTQQGNKLVGTGAVNGTNGALQGWSVSISADGNTAIVAGIGDNSGAGAVWIFTRTGGLWSQQGNKLVGTGAINGINGAQQGYSVSISADGETCIVGGNQDNNDTGAVWIFTRSANVWSQQGNKLIGTGAINGSYGAAQGNSVSISADGNTAVVGGLNDNTAIGAVWVFTRKAGVWTQQGNKLVGTGWVGHPAQGNSVSISADGNTAVVGGYLDSSYVGAAWVYTRSVGVWTQQGNKLVGTGAVYGNSGSQQGWSVSISADGNTAIVGGLDDNNDAGAAWVFVSSPNFTSINEFTSPSINSEIFPNPFATSATIKFSVTSTNIVKLELFEMSGKKISILIDEKREVGNYNVALNNEGYSNEMYFYRLQVGESVETKKIVIR